MRRWIALTLVSCSRPNPLFIEEGGATEIETASSSMSAATSVTTDAVTTGTPVPGTSSSGTSPSGSTTDTLPLCGEFSLDRVGFNPLLSQALCESVTPFFVDTALVGDAIQLTPCLDIDCLTCYAELSATLPPQLTPLFSPGKCMQAKHEGQWVPAGDPEVITQCKTTGVALYDNDSVYPLYAASAGVLHPPSFLDPDVKMTVQRGVGERCACADAECCLDQQASFYDVEFLYNGVSLAKAGGGDSFDATLKGALYTVGVTRAYSKGYASTTDGACVVDPETPYVDWLMVRLLGP